MEQNPKFQFFQQPTRGNTSQPLFGWDVVEIKAKNFTSGSKPSVLKFDFPNNAVLLPGINTKFCIKAQFLKKQEGSTEWEGCTAADADNVCVVTNFWEKMIERCEILVDNHVFATPHEPSHIAPYLNSFLYAYMHKDLKQILCTSEAHPAKFNSINHTKWGPALETWKTIATSVFKGSDDFQFYWTPLMWPFSKAEIMSWMVMT